MNSQCILITGPGHSATRLLVQMLSCHPDISVPMDILNKQMEYPIIRDFFWEQLDQTPFSVEEYNFDKEDFYLIMTSYLEKIEVNKSFFVFKLPYYPLNILDIFTELFEQGSLIYAVRPKHKVIKSFASRPYMKDSLWLERQIKKLPVSLRQKHLMETTIDELTKDFIEHCEHLRDQWDSEHPDMKFYPLEVERFSTESQYIEEVLKDLGLETNSKYLHEMMSLVNTERLLQESSRKKQEVTRKLSPVSRLEKYIGKIF
ncbi:MAG: hypothetical protein QNJ08_08905 [Crocosphaera sp.]|nr:hypothetical protein [Crocosphaera sp.]